MCLMCEEEALYRAFLDHLEKNAKAAKAGAAAKPAFTVDAPESEPTPAPMIVPPAGKTPRGEDE
jgi:hypothetical protein